MTSSKILVGRFFVRIPGQYEEKVTNSGKVLLRYWNLQSCVKYKYYYNDLQTNRLNVFMQCFQSGGEYSLIWFPHLFVYPKIRRDMIVQITQMTFTSKSEGWRSFLLIQPYYYYYIPTELVDVISYIYKGKGRAILW